MAKQPAPDPGTDYRTFPDVTTSREELRYRAHNVRHGAWYFDDSRYGRFNLSSPQGTCYAAGSLDTAVREKLRDAILSTNVVSRTLADSFRVAELRILGPLRMAGVSEAGAAAFHVVRELCTMEGYAIPQKWAKAFSDVGFKGIAYGSSYTSGPADAWALFGTAGPDDVRPSSPFLDGVDACRRIGLAVEDPPHSHAMTVI